MTEPTTEAGRALLERAWNPSDYLRGAILAIETESRADCEAEFMRQRDCDHSECIEREEQGRADALREAAERVSHAEPTKHTVEKAGALWGWNDCIRQVLAIFDPEPGHLALKNYRAALAAEPPALDWFRLCIGAGMPDAMAHRWAPRFDREYARLAREETP